MGYTNYWTQHKDISMHDWIQIQREVEYLREYIGDGCIEVDKNDPEIISFNGRGDNAHEDFCIRRKRWFSSDKQKANKSHSDNDGFNFCKTNRKPYDLAVWHMLTFMSHLLGKDFEISRDG